MTESETERVQKPWDEDEWPEPRKKTRDWTWAAIVALLAALTLLAALFVKCGGTP